MAQKGFNLLQPQEPPPTFWDKAYAWVVGTARIIIIVVELLVFGAFAARFILDTRTKTMDEQIDLHQRRLDALKEKEIEFRIIQAKGEMHTQLWEKSSSYDAVLAEIDSYLPTNAKDLVLQIDESQIVIRGFADLKSVSALELALKSSDTFENTEVFEIQEEQGSSDEGQGTFAVRAVIKSLETRTL